MSHDGWTADSGEAYVNINNHYTISPPDRPNDWEIVTDELAFLKLEGRHTGANIGGAISAWAGLVWITSDGAAVNRSTAKTAEHGLDERDEGWTAAEHDMMCIEHVVHIASKHFVEAKLRTILDAACSSGEIGADEVAKCLDSLGGEDDEPDESDNSMDSEWTAGDAVGKILALIKQLNSLDSNVASSAGILPQMLCSSRCSSATTSALGS
ncbi:hypothetical protein B0H14DRAFT_3025273, partial [Mycena olivaceomarginata]